MSLLPVEPLNRAPLCLQVARQLRDAIIDGTLDNGAPIPSEKALSEQLGVGRSTVREALRILQAQGLISGGDSVSTKKPTVTSDGVVPSAATALENALLLSQIPLADLVALRITIEREAVQIAARSPDPDAITAAEAALDEMRAGLGDAERFHRADVAFHEALLRCSGNVAFALVMNVLRGAAAQHLSTALHREDDLLGVTRVLLDEHEAILRAIVLGEGEIAAALVRAHIHNFYARHLP